MAAGGGAGASLPAGERSRDDWLRIYDRMVAMLRKSQKQVEALAGDRARLEAVIKIQHEFWVSRDGILQGCLDEMRRTDACRRRCDAAKLELLLGDKERELRRYLEYAKLQDDDMEDFKICTGTLAGENAQLKKKTKGVESRAVLSENMADHEGSARNFREEMRTLKKAYTTLSSKKEKEISALLAEKDFVWNQLKTMEKDYNSVLKKKKMEAAQATEAAQKLQKNVEELQVAAQKKESEISQLQAEADHAKKKILVLEDKLQEMYTLANEKDDEIKKLKGGHRQASQKHKQDINGTHIKSRSEGPALRGKSKNNLRKKMVEEDQPQNSQKRKSRSEGPALRGKSKNNPRRKMVEEDQPQNSQKRKCAPSLATGLRRCSSRLHSKSPVSPAPQQLLDRVKLATRDKLILRCLALRSHSKRRLCL